MKTKAIFVVLLFILLPLPNEDGKTLHIIQGRDTDGRFIWNVVFEPGAEYAQVIDPQDKFELGFFKKTIKEYLGRR
jgi:hypothetical protein